MSTPFVKAPRRLLVASNSTIVLRTIRDTVHRYSSSMQIIETADGHACLHSLSNDQIDAAFIEVALPAISGLEALAMARANWHKTLTALISENQSAELMDIARKLSVYDLLIKPIKMNNVKAVFAAFAQLSKPLRLLVIDSSDAVRRVIRKVLSTSLFQFDIHEAADGDTALQMLSDKAFDLVLLDYQINDFRDIKTLEKLISASVSVGVIIMSTIRSERVARLSLDHGATAFISKPFYGPDIDMALQRIFGLRIPRLWLQKIDISRHFVPVIPGDLRTRSTPKYAWP